MPYKDIEKRREIGRLNYKKNKEKIAKKRAKDLLNPIKHQAKLNAQAKYRLNNPDKLRIYKSKWLADNREEHAESCRKWREENKEHVKIDRRNRYVRTGE